MTVTLDIGDGSFRRGNYLLRLDAPRASGRPLHGYLHLDPGPDLEFTAGIEVIFAPLWGGAAIGLFQLHTGVKRLKLTLFEGAVGASREVRARAHPISQTVWTATLYAMTIRRQIRAPGDVRSALVLAARRLRTLGPRAFLAVLRHRSTAVVDQTSAEYEAWIRTHEPCSDEDFRRLDALTASLAVQPTFSILLPVGAAGAARVASTVAWLRAQRYQGWEALLVLDGGVDPEVRRHAHGLASTEPRLRVIELAPRLRAISAYLSAAAEAVGGFVAPLSPGDGLPPHALSLCAIEHNEHPQASIIYGDEDRLDGSGRRSAPWFKTDWNPGLLLSQNYLGGLTLYRADRFLAACRSTPAHSSGGLHGLALRCAGEASPRGIRHIPHILCHRPANGALAECDARHASMETVAEHLIRTGASARVEPAAVRGGLRVRYLLPDPAPRVSIIIPTRDRAALLRTAVDSIVGRTAYPDFQVVIVDNGTTETSAVSYLEELRRGPRTRVLDFPAPFNYAAMNNYAVSRCDTPFVCLMNNDVEVLSPEWLTEMVGHALQPQIGAVGAKLLYADGTIQHAGVIVGLHGAAAHPFKGLPADAPGYHGRAQFGQDLSAVTAACLVVRRESYVEVGGFDETHLTVAFNDVDFCLKLRAAGLRNYWTPYAVLVHHESKSRGQPIARREAKREEREAAVLRERWAPVLGADPAYNPNLSLDGAAFRLACAPRINKPWA